MSSSINGGANRLDIFELGPCENAYQMGYEIGSRFSSLIQSRLATDLILRTQLRPFALTQPGQRLIASLKTTNQTRFPEYWDELVGTAEGSRAPLVDIILINFRKEILPFIPNKEEGSVEESMAEDCSDVMVVDDRMAVVAHNEDGNVALIGRAYLIKASIGDGESFTAYTYAGELPSCAFGFNSHGMGFTLDSVPPSIEEIEAGGIGRNFISRGLLEATSLDDALTLIQKSQVSVGHSYNLIEFPSRRVLNVETASKGRISIRETKRDPFFHANMYLHLPISQVEDENSKSRQKRAVLPPKLSKLDFLSLLGNTEDEHYPIYMKGPTLYTLCTAMFDLDEHTMSIYQGNPKEQKLAYLFHLKSQS